MFGEKNMTIAPTNSHNLPPNYHARHATLDILEPISLDRAVSVAALAIFTRGGLAMKFETRGGTVYQWFTDPFSGDRYGCVLADFQWLVTQAARAHRDGARELGGQA